jgi:hypothetical protein
MKLFVKSTAILALSFFLGSALAVAQSDESGTLVMAARTPDGVVLAVDSAVTNNGVPTVNGHRKLVDVGQSGACAIAGFVGNEEHGNDISQTVRSWLKANPDVSGMAAISGILKIATKSWDSEHYSLGHLPDNRQPGDDITGIICADQLPDGPAILEAHTNVATNGSAQSYEPFKVFGSFECNGFCTYDTIVGLIKNPNPPQPATSKIESRETYPKIRKDILSNPLAYKAVQAFIAEQKRTDELRRETGGRPSFPFISTLDQAQVKILFVAYFKSVERYTKHVAPPNVVRLIRACGRFNSTVEGPWPTCKQ